MTLIPNKESFKEMERMKEYIASTEALTTELMVLRELNSELVEMLERVKIWWDSDDIINDHLPIEEIESLIQKAKEV